MRRQLVGFLLLSILSAACGQITVSEPPRTTSAAGVGSSGDTTAVARDFDEQPCSFETGVGDESTIEVTCGSLTVPLDRDDPVKTTTLAVAIYDEPGVTDPVPTIYLHGGPGSGGVLFDVGPSFDRVVAPFLPLGPVVVFDQRGAGLSDPPPACDDLWVVDSQLTGTDEENSLVGDLFLQLAPDCRATAERAGFELEHYHSIANARDVADLAATLGYDEVNLYGGSYGSRLAQTVMREFPDLVRAAALSGVYPTTVDLSDGTATGFVEALDHVIATCEADTDCNAAFPDLDGAFASGYQRLDRAPQPLEFTSDLGTVFRAFVDGDDYASTVFSMLYDAEAVASLPELITQVERGDTELLWRYFEWYGFATTTDFWQVYASVLCSDEVSLRTGRFESPNLADRFLASDLLPGLHGQVLNELCDDWPHEDAPPVENDLLQTTIPILLINGLFDPITPASWATALHEQLPTSRLVLLPHQGHGVLGDFCVQRLVTAFLSQPLVPVDPSCADTTMTFRTEPVGPPELTTSTFTTFEGESYELDAPSNWLGYWLDGGSIYYRDRDNLDETALMFSLSAEPGTAEQVLIDFIELPEVDADDPADGWESRRRFETPDRVAVVMTRTIDGIEYAFGFRGYTNEDLIALEGHLEEMFDSVVRP